VAIVEKAQYGEARVGETLPPGARPLLAKLAVWEKFLAAAHLPSPGVLSAWGEQELYQTHFVFNPYGQGWHIDRRRFDVMLAQAARYAGARLYCGTKVDSCLPLPGDRWDVTFTSRAGQHQLRASYLIDATGRASALGRRQGARRLAADRLIGLAGELVARTHESGRCEGGCDSCTLVEACTDGWWYSALLPSGRLMTVYMTDADLLRRQRGEWQAFWRARLRQTVHTRARLRAFEPQAAPRVLAANSSRLDRVSGRGWLAVGDAAMAFDPLSSQGLKQALASGIRAGEALNRHLVGEAAAIGEYDVTANEVFREYVRLHGVYYGRERRWPQSDFWRRRHAAAA
jgi:flavin-dependent dehydrogenase